MKVLDKGTKACFNIMKVKGRGTKCVLSLY